MKCKQHGWTYTVKRHNRSFCVLCRDLRKLEIGEQTRVDGWLASHKELSSPSTSVFAFRISNLHVRAEDAGGQARLAVGAAVQGEVEGSGLLRSAVGSSRYRSEERNRLIHAELIAAFDFWLFVYPDST